MANTKLDRIERDIEKTRAKILEQQKKLKDLEAQKVEEENAQIVQMVKAVHLDGTQLWLMFRLTACSSRIYAFVSLRSTTRIYPSIAILRKYAPYCFMGSCFIFSSISRFSSSVT